mgnify:CR=1 FL=1
MTFTLFEVIAYLKEENYLSRNFNVQIDQNLKGFSPISNTKKKTVTWYKGERLNVDTIDADVVICKKDFVIPSQTSIIFIPTDNPRIVFAKLLSKFATKKIERKIADTVQFGENIKIGKNVAIGHHVVIGDDVMIGDGTVIKHNVVIGEKVEIGENCLIHSGVVIGADGFGYEKDEEGDYFKMPHIGGVTIGNDVEIGTNTCIDRGTLGNTVIQDNVKIDNLVHVAHNVQVKRNSMLIAQSMIGGSTVIEENSWIAPGAVIMNGITVGKNTTVGLGAVVTKNVENSDIVAGVPAKSLKVRKDK